MKTKISTLPNGLKIITNEMPGARSVTATIMVGAGGRTEKFATEGGVSHFLEHVLFKGSTKRPSAKQISQEIDAVGGYNGAYTTSDTTGFYVKVPKQHLSLALDIMADMIIEPLLEEAEIDRERGVIIEEINWRRHDDASQLVSSLIPPLLWPNDALGQDVAGNEEVIRTVDRARILAYKQKFYLPNNMAVSVAGGVKHEQVLELVRELMGQMVPGKIPTSKPISPTLSDQRVAVYNKSTAQANFIIGARAYPYWHKLDPAMSVLTTILGSGMSSRLSLNVRESKALAYDVGAYRQNFVDSGIFEVYAAANSEKTDEAIAAVIEELDRVKSEKVPDEELAKGKNKIKGGLQMALESNGSIADRFGSQLLLLGKVRSIEDTIKRIDAVSANQVMQVAREILDHKQLRMAIVASDGTSAKLKFEELTS